MRKIFIPLILFAFVVIVNTSCEEEDPCANVACLNGGTCAGGTCSCAEGFTGDRCQDLDLKEFTFVNKAPTDVNIWVDNAGPYVIISGESMTFDGKLGTTVDFYANTSGKTSTGTVIGTVLEWEGTITYDTDPQSTNLIVTNTWFFLKIKNNTSNNLSSLYVNYGLASQTLDNISFGNGGPYNLGYYRAFSNGNVRIFITSTSTYYYWNHGTHYTLPGTDNQIATLTANP